MAVRFRLFKVNTPPCPACKSTNTAKGRTVRIAAGLGLGVLGSLVVYVAGYIYPVGRILIPFLVVAGLIMAVIPPLAKYCCLDCDGYWNDGDTKVWRPRDPGA